MLKRPAVERRRANVLVAPVESGPPVKPEDDRGYGGATVLQRKAASKDAKRPTPPPPCSAWSLPDQVGEGPPEGWWRGRGPPPQSPATLTWSKRKWPSGSTTKPVTPPATAAVTSAWAIGSHGA